MWVNQAAVCCSSVFAQSNKRLKSLIKGRLGFKFAARTRLKRAYFNVEQTAQRSNSVYLMPRTIAKRYRLVCYVQRAGVVLGCADISREKGRNENVGGLATDNADSKRCWRNAGAG